MDNEIAKKLMDVINEVKSIRVECETKGLLDTQEYINFEDELNAISVMSPTAKI